ncbi:MAG: S8 family serine peptidase, partial [Thermofilum sp.]
MIKEILTLLMLLASLLINQASQEYGLRSDSLSTLEQPIAVFNTHVVIHITGTDTVPAQRGTLIDFGDVEVGSSVRGGIDFVCNADYCWVAGIIIYPQPPFYWIGCVPSIGSKVPRGGVIRCDIEFRPQDPGTFSSVARVQACKEGIEGPPPLNTTHQPLYTCSTFDIVMRGRGLLPPNKPPVAVCSFSPSNPTTDTWVHFSSAGSYDPDGWIESYNWDFGDGTTSTSPNPVHRYEREGTYSARLTVRDNRGAYSNPAICTVVVSRPSPRFDPVKLAASGGSGVLAGMLTYNMLSQPPAPPPMAPGFAPAILPATIAVVAGLYLFPVDQLIVRFPKGVTQQQAQRLLSQVIPASEIIGFFSPANAYLVRFRGIDQIAQMEDKVKELERIEAELKRGLPQGSSVLKNYLGKLEGQPDIDRLERDLRLAYDAVLAKPTWDLLAQSQTRLHPVRVVIIDSGIAGTHPEFKDVPRWGSSYVKKNDEERESWWDDPQGHGTQVSGIIGAQNGWGRMNGIISAVNQNYALQMYKVTLDPSKVALPADQPLPPRNITAPVFSVLDAIRVGVSEAERRGAVVVNISMGWDRSSVKNEEEIREIYNIFRETMRQYPKILFVTSAGNGDKPEDLHISQGLNVKQIMHAPGGVDADNIITVAATDAVGLSLAQFSNYGPGVDIAAPGVNVFTTDNNGSYASVSGTSFSAAMVSGAAALLLSIEPSLSPKEVKEILQATASHNIASPQGRIGLLKMAEAVKLTLEKKAEKDRQRLGLAALVGIATAVM